MVGAEPAGVVPQSVPFPYLGQPTVYPDNPLANPPSGDCYLYFSELTWESYIPIMVFDLSEELRMKTLKRQLNVFLVHAHTDRRTVHGLYARIAKEGIKAWLDTKNLLPGQDWKHEIRRAILVSDIVIVCLSKRFIRHNGYCQEELRIALKKANLLPDGETFIIPVRLEECDTPEFLRRWHRVDLFETDGYRKLIRSLRKYVGSV